MADDRVIIPFPSDTIRLNGVLQDTLSTIRCATSCLTVKEYLGARFTFLLVCNQVVMGALKSLSAKQEICFDSSAACYAEKHMAGLPIEEMVLTALFIASIEKTIALYSEITFADSAGTLSEKFAEYMVATQVFQAQVSVYSEKTTSLSTTIKWNDIIKSLCGEKQLGPGDIISKIESVLALSSDKYCGETLSEATFSSCARFAIFEYRRLHHIDSLVFSDIDAWNMDTFDVIYK